MGWVPAHLWVHMPCLNGNEIDSQKRAFRDVLVVCTEKEYVALLRLSGTIFSSTPFPLAV